MVDMAFGLCGNYFVERVQTKQVKAVFFGCSVAAGFIDGQYAFFLFFFPFPSPASSEKRQEVRKYTLRGLKKSGPKEEDTQSAKRDNTMVSGLEPSAMNDMMQATTVS